MSEFDMRRFDLYTQLIKKYIEAPTQKIKGLIADDLETLKNGLIPIKFMADIEGIMADIMKDTLGDDFEKWSDIMNEYNEWESELNERV